MVLNLRYLLPGVMPIQACAYTSISSFCMFPEVINLPAEQGSLQGWLKELHDCVSINFQYHALYFQNLKPIFLLKLNLQVQYYNSTTAARPRCPRSAPPPRPRAAHSTHWSGSSSLKNVAVARRTCIRRWPEPRKSPVGWSVVGK